MVIRGRRAELRKVFESRLAAQLEAARFRLREQEAALLTKIAGDVFESEEARNMLADIPSIDDLLPAADLAQLKAEAAPQLPWAASYSPSLGGDDQ